MTHSALTDQGFEGESSPHRFKGRSVQRQPEERAEEANAIRPRHFHDGCRHAVEIHAAGNDILKQVSISPTFDQQLFRTKVCCAAFMCNTYGYVIFWPKEIGMKTAC